MEKTLSVDESDRANRFHFPKDRQNFIVARGILRTILGCYLKIKPERLHFCYGKYGKPELAPVDGPVKINFNLSHSGGLALYAFANDRKVGIDVESIHTDLEYDEIAARFFSPSEISAFKNLPLYVKPEAFFNCWTRKEAYVKAIGNGLSWPLDQFDVSLVPGEPATLLQTRGDPTEASRWSLVHLQPKTGYVAAIAAEGHKWRISYWRWQA